MKKILVAVVVLSEDISSIGTCIGIQSNIGKKVYFSLL